MERKGKMGGDTDGSPLAARSAPPEETDRSTPLGLIGRIFGAFGQGDTRSDSVNGGAVGGGSENPAQMAVGPPAAGLGNLRKLRVYDVAIPTVEIEAVPVDISKEDLVAAFKRSGNSRLPVYNGTLDQPLGLIHLKDFALTHGFNGGSGRFNLKKLLRPLLYAPPSMPIGILLQKMQSERIHMALVIDEYGGVDGLVTIEDLIEQVVGEIEDEHDTAEDRLWREEKPGVYVAQARTPLDEFEAEVGVKLAEAEVEEEIDTLGGLVFMMIGRVPARGEVIPHPSGAEFEVIDADPRRIKRLRVRLPQAAAE